MHINQSAVDEVEVEVSDMEDKNEIEEYENSEDSEHELDEGLVFASTVLEYDDSVFVCAFSPNSSMVATGSQDDKAYLVDSSTQELIHTIDGHKDSVTCLGFSKNGKFLATGDLSGHIQVLNITTNETVWENTICGDLNWLIWHNYSSFLLAGNSEGEIWLWLMPHGQSKLVHCSGVPTQVSALSPDGKRIAVGYDDSNVRLLDLKTCSVLASTYICKGSPVTAMSFHRDNIMIIAGTENGCSKILSSNSGKVTCSFLTEYTNTEDVNNENVSLEAAQFCPHIPNYVVLAQTLGTLSIYDMNNPEVKRHEIRHCATSTIVWHPIEPYFYTACLDGKIKCYDVRNGELIKQYGGHTDQVLDIAIKNDCTLLMSASDDKTARIFVL